MPVSGAVRAHLVSFLGPPSREASFESADAEIEILKWARSRLGVTLYCTIGASRVVGPGSNHRLEYVLGLTSPRDDVVTVLAELALEPVRGGVLVSDGQAVTFPSPLWPGTVMTTLLVARFPDPPHPRLDTGRRLPPGVPFGRPDPCRRVAGQGAPRTRRPVGPVQGYPGADRGS